MLKFIQIFFIIVPFIIQGQSRITYKFNKNNQLTSENYYDSFSIHRNYDSAYNAKEIAIINPCSKRPTPTIISSNGTKFCENKSTVLTAPSNKSYLWNTGETTRSITVNKKGDYYVYVTGTLNCTQKSVPISIKIDSLPKPIIDIIGKAEFCYGESVKLRSRLQGIYLWNNIDTNQTIKVTNSKVNILKFKDKNGCLGYDTLIVKVFPKPKSKFTLLDTAMCFKNNSFNFINKSTIDTGQLKYYWQFGDGAIDSTLNVNHNYKSSDSFKISLIAISNMNCIDTSFSKALVYPQVDVAFTINNKQQCLINNQFVFTNQSTIIKGGFSEKWFINNQISNLNFKDTISFDSVGNYNIQLITSSYNNCIDTSETYTIKVLKNPNVSILYSDSVFCVGDSLLIQGNGAVEYQWSNGINNRINIVKNAGNYYVLGIDSFGCENMSQTLKIKSNPEPIKPEIFKSFDSLKIINNLYSVIKWYKDDILFNSDNKNYVLTNGDGEYYVIVENEFGCEIKSDSFNLNTTSFKQFSNENIKIFPNPNNGLFYIEVKNQMDSLICIITDIRGRIIKQNVIEYKNDIIQFQFDEAAGIYFIQIKNGSNVLMYSKLIKL